MPIYLAILQTIKHQKANTMPRPPQLGQKKIVTNISIHPILLNLARDYCYENHLSFSQLIQDTLMKIFDLNDSDLENETAIHKVHRDSIVEPKKRENEESTGYVIDPDLPRPEFGGLNFHEYQKKMLKK